MTAVDASVYILEYSGNHLATAAAQRLNREGFHTPKPRPQVQAPTVKWDSAQGLVYNALLCGSLGGRSPSIKGFCAAFVQQD